MSKYNFFDQTTGELLGTVTQPEEEREVIKKILDFQINENGFLSVGRAFTDGTKARTVDLFTLDPVSALYTQEVLEMCVARALVKNLHLFNIRMEEVTE